MSSRKVSNESYVTADDASQASSEYSTSSEEVEVHYHEKEDGAVTLVALYDYTGLTERELSSLNEGDTVALLDDTDPAWWFVRNESGQEGFVPRTYLAEANTVRDLGSRLSLLPDHESGGAALRHRSSSGARRASMVSIINTRHTGTERSPERSAAESETVEALHAHRHRPRFVSMAQVASTSSQPALASAHEKRAALGQKYRQGQGLLSTILVPALEEDQIGFSDLFIDPTGNVHEIVQSLLILKILRYPAPVHLLLRIKAARRIPLTAVGARTVSRHVRMGLMARGRLYGNIHTVQAQLSHDLDKTWRFTESSSLLFPQDDPLTCVVRSTVSDTHLTLVMELCAIVEYYRVGAEQSQPPVRAELSCGWVSLPLYNSEGEPMPHKTYRLRLQGGSPFARNLQHDALDEAVTQAALEDASHPWWTALRGRKMPQVIVRTWRVGSTATDQLKYMLKRDPFISSTLPTNIISFVQNISLLSHYRQLLAKTLLKEAEEPIFQAVQAPSLAAMLRIADVPDVLKVLSEAWEQKFRRLKRTEKKSLDSVLTHWQSVVMSVAPLLYMQNVPLYRIGDMDTELLRARVIEQYRMDGPVHTQSINPCGFQFAPFDASEEIFFASNKTGQLPVLDS